MKVTISFGDMRIIVPCGDGELLVSELIDRAVSRYKKAVQKGEHCVVQVKYLETVKEHGRLDVDDKVGDVCDDKDLLTAVYNVGHKHVTMDDAVIIKDELSNEDRSKRDAEDTNHYVTSALSDNDSGVAADVFGLPSNTDSEYRIPNADSASKPPRGLHRQSSKNKNSSFRSSISSNSPSSSPDLPRHTALKNNPFSRDSNRKSLSTNHPILYKWIDQQEKASYMGISLDDDSDKSIESEEIHLDEESVKCVDIKPYTNADGVEIGLIVHNIVEGCYVDCIGELEIADRITEVNGISLHGFSNDASLSIFNEAIKLGEITIKRTRSHTFLKERLKKEETRELGKELAAFSPPKQILKQTIEEDTSAKESAVEAPTVDTSTDDKQIDVFTVGLTKGASGLGFTVTTKDVLTSKTTRIFIKNILQKGAAIQDGRIESGDELLMVNDVPVSGKSQSDVVKLLRQADGTVVLKLSRLKGNIPPPVIKSHVTPPTSPLAKKQQITSPPVIKAMLPSPLIKTPLGPSPLMKNALESNPSYTKSNGSSPTPILKVSRDVEPIERKDFIGKDVLDEAPLVTKGYINLTVPIRIQSNVGLGISVKGKIMKETGEEKGIFVKSIVPGTNAEKDGRVFVGDQLTAINDTPLTNMGNSSAMAILKRTLSEAGKEGVIRINVNRSVFPAESTDSESAPSHTSCGSVSSQSEYSQAMSKVDEKIDLDKHFDQLYLTESSKPLSHKDSENHILRQNINRNKSYFKAVGGHASPKTLDGKPKDSLLNSNGSQPMFFQPEKTESPKIDPNISCVDGKLWAAREKEIDLPSYEEALQNRTEKPPKTEKSTSKHETVKFNLSASTTTNGTTTTLKNENNKNNRTSSLNKSLSFESKRRLPSETDIQLDASFSNNSNKMTRGISTVSQSSIDSILIDPKGFTRDGPGRLSMSEKKGRAHIDATKSRFYNKLKKFKSMEELRGPEAENYKNQDFNEMDVRRVSSIDTITSRLDEEEKNAALFNRNTVYSASTPYYTTDEQRNRAGQRLRDDEETKQQHGHSNNNNNINNDNEIKFHTLKTTSVVLRPPKPNRSKHLNGKQRPLSMQVEDMRARNNALNESFKSALERTKSTSASDYKDSSDDKKKKGFLNSIGVFLKRAKKRKEDDTDISADYITHPSKFPFNKSIIDGYADVENNNGDNSSPDPSKYLQADMLQKQLVEAKISEMNARSSGDRKDKSSKNRNSKNNNNNNNNNNDLNKNESEHQINKTPKRNPEKPYVPLSGYHTWQAHDPKNMREKSKEFFTRDSVNYQSAGSNSLQRQSSLPPKNSSEVHRVLPRAPSGPMYKSPERTSKARNNNNNNNNIEHSSPSVNRKTTNPNNKSDINSRSTPKKYDKNSQQQQTPQHRTPGKLKQTDSHPTPYKKTDGVVRRERRDRGSIGENNNGQPRLRRKESLELRRDDNTSHNNNDTVMNRRSMPSISDLKLRSSVSISHKAQI